MSIDHTGTTYSVQSVKLRALLPSATGSNPTTDGTGGLWVG